MKLKKAEEEKPKVQVAPFAGAWIEININIVDHYMVGSLPSRERGLKLKKKIRVWMVRRVAPFAGAWIEINNKHLYQNHKHVAPFAGAWIEIT